VISDILTVVAKGALKTQIMYRANLSFAQLQEYLDFLLETGLIKEVSKPSGSHFEITAKGLEALDAFEHLKSLFSSKETIVKVVRK